MAFVKTVCVFFFFVSGSVFRYDIKRYFVFHSLNKFEASCNCICTYMKFSSEFFTRRF